MVVKTTLIRLFILVVLHSKTANTTTTSNFFLHALIKLRNLDAMGVFRIPVKQKQ